MYPHSVSNQAFFSQHAADSQRLVAHSRKVENLLSLVPAVHLLSHVKGRNSESTPHTYVLYVRMFVHITFTYTSSLTTQLEGSGDWRRVWVPGSGSLSPIIKLCKLTDNIQRDRYGAPSSTSGSRAHAHASCPLSIPSLRSILKAQILSGRSIVAYP